MFELRIEQKFFASHALRLYDGSREPVHAHDWRVVVEVRSEKLDGIDVVMDFHALEGVVGGVLEGLRGRDLNEHPAFAAANPSAERVAEHVYREVAGAMPKGVVLRRVTV